MIGVVEAGTIVSPECRVVDKCCILKATFLGDTVGGASGLASKSSAACIFLILPCIENQDIPAVTENGWNK